TRVFIISTFALATIILESLTVIDQYFITSRSVRLRNCSKIKTAHRLTISITLICILHEILFTIYYDLRVSTSVLVCENTSPILQFYHTWIFFIVILTVLPLLVLLVFGLLTYRNIHILK